MTVAKAPNNAPQMWMQSGIALLQGVTLYAIIHFAGKVEDISQQVALHEYRLSVIEHKEGVKGAIYRDDNRECQGESRRVAGGVGIDLGRSGVGFSLVGR